MISRSVVSSLAPNGKSHEDPRSTVCWKRSKNQHEEYREPLDIRIAPVNVNKLGRSEQCHCDDREPNCDGHPYAGAMFRTIEYRGGAIWVDVAFSLVIRVPYLSRVGPSDISLCMPVVHFTQPDAAVMAGIVRLSGYGGRSRVCWLVV